MERGISVQEMLKGLWRRRRLVVLVFAGVFAAGVWLVALMPSVYRASTVMQVEPYRPVIELVQPSVTLPIEEKLRTGAQELLSRSILERAVTELDLFPKARSKRGMDAAIGELRSMIDVKLEGDRAFELIVEGEGAEQVAKIANLLPKLYSEQVLRGRAEQAEAISRLFDDELARVGERVTQLEQQVTAFKLAHLGELPEQAESNMRGLERIMGVMTARVDARRELHRRLIELREGRGGAETELGRLRRRHLDLKSEQIAARSQWTEDHPEVERIGRELGTVGQQIAKAEAGAQQIDAERAFLRGQLANLEAEIKGLESESALYRGRLDRTPQWAQQLSVLNRDYELMRAKYQSLLSRKVEAEVAQELEAKARPGMFRILSQATPPSAPFKPDRTAALALALLASLGLGVLAGIFRELQDDSLRRAEHARELSMQVLALVPRIQPAGQHSRLPRGGD